jgi:hypothetical protein
MKNISIDEWLAELGRVSQTDDSGAKTTAEIVAETGWSSMAVRQAIRRGLENGTLERIFVPRETIAGTQRREPGYRPMKKPGRPAVARQPKSERKTHVHP